MNIVDVPLADIEEAPFNYNLHPQNQIDELRGSLEEFGQFKNIVLWKGYCIAGNGLTFAARSMGWKSLKSIIRDDLTEEQAKRLCVADNATPYLAMPDSQKLEDLLKSLPSFDDIPGVNEDWLNTLDLSFDSLLDMPDADLDDPAADEVPEVEESITKLGDLWQLGDHRLLCGDSTDNKNISALLAQSKVHTIFTDPPYGMKLDTDYSSMKSGLKFAQDKSAFGGKEYKAVIGDDEDYDPSHIFKSFPRVREMFLWGADYYAERLEDKNSGSWFVWDKRLDESADKMYGSCFELCWSKNKHKRDVARIKWAGVFGTEQEFDKKRHHPTQKPIALVVWFLNRYTEDGWNVADLFGGSGSTLIACEKIGRKCFMMELDPHYCTVIIKRWEQYTGKQAVLLT